VIVRFIYLHGTRVFRIIHHDYVYFFHKFKIYIHDVCYTTRHDEVRFSHHTKQPTILTHTFFGNRSNENEESTLGVRRHRAYSRRIVFVWRTILDAIGNTIQTNGQGPYCDTTRAAIR
jgi:hypothetical protein